MEQCLFYRKFHAVENLERVELFRSTFFEFLKNISFPKKAMAELLFENGAKTCFRCRNSAGELRGVISFVKSDKAKCRESRSSTLFNIFEFFNGFFIFDLIVIFVIF